MTSLMILIGLAALLVGGDLLVRGAVALARLFGLSPLVVGLVLVGFGTSTPELVTSVRAALAGSPAIAVGNVVGSNIFNTFGILGVTALVQPLEIPAEVIRFDVWVMLAATLALCALPLIGGRINRREGLVGVAAYAGYITLLFG